ncbi:hypothetical protein [Chryseobacterium sp. CT-SW4]|uniref:hypothetical protein n=1 Tax=Chryseobacterium sp. SW-1 TaxID=3157343 RepID=UPI003B017319
MKHLTQLFSSILMICSYVVFSQVGINTNTPHSKAALDIVSTNNDTGVLFPRLTTSQRGTISPTIGDLVVDGLWIYNTDTKCYNYWQADSNNQWVELCGNSTVFQLYCSDLVRSGTPFVESVPNTGFVTIPYSSSSTDPYAGQTINSTGVTGLTATLAPGTLSNGNGDFAFTVTGTPSSSGTASFLFTINNTTCTFSVNVSPGTATINCAAAVVTGTLMSGSPASGVSVSIPYTNGNGGPYTAQSIASTGVTGLTASIPAGNFANGNGNLVFTISGTPNTSGTASFNLNMGGTNCTFTVDVALGLAQYSSCSMSTQGTYTVATSLTSSNTLTATLNVTVAGRIRLRSQDKNGILFDSGEVTVGTGSQTVTLNSITATSGRFPMTAEEVSNGGNGANNQTSTYTITNTLNNTTLPCSATIDVKPRIWQNFVPTGNDTATTGPLYTGANNGMIDLEMQNNSTFQFGGIGLYYKVWARNVSGSTFNYSIVTRSSADPPSAALTWSSSLTNNSRVGSLDVYLQSGNRAPSTTGEIGAHAGPNAAFASENSETGMNITLGNVTDTSKWFNNLGTKIYKYRLIFNSKDYRTSGTNLAVVLYGIYDTTVSVTNFDPGDLTVRGGDPQQTYWP